MKLDDFRFGPSVCMEAFPFHMILDKDLCVLQVGHGLKKLMPAIEPGRHVPDLVSEQNAAARLAYEDIEDRIDSTFHLRSRANAAAEVRGGFYLIDDCYLLFIGHPVIRDTKEIARLSLKFTDIARHDPFLYYMAALQAKEALLQDSRMLVSRLEHVVEKRMEQLREQADELRLTESRLNEAQRIAKIGSFEWNIPDNSLWWSKERYRLAGQTPGTVKPSRESFLEAVHVEDRQRVTRAIDGALRSGRRFSVDYRLVLPDGSVRYAHSQGTVTTDQDGRPLRVAGTTQDITDRVDLEREAVAASELERRRIGHDLHDGLGQVLTGVSLRLQHLYNELAREGSPHARAVQGLTATIQETIAETRRVTRDLAPGLLTEQGIGEALRSLAESINNHPEVTCTVRWSIDEDVRDKKIATHLFRIAQESINNAIRHGGAQNIDLRLERRGDLQFLEILDDGSGIPPEGQRIEGLGLKSMHYRARMLAGRLEITPRSEGGTRVLCCYPSGPIDSTPLPRDAWAPGDPLA